MVQYYYPVFLKKEGEGGDPVRAWVNPTNYGTGLKLMEHTNRDSSLVASVASLIREDGYFGPTPLVWAGDYAEVEPGHEDLNLFKMCSESTEILPDEFDMSHYRYIVNHTKGQFVDRDRADKYTNLHPLPLLTAEGNKFGPRDYPVDHNLVGYWARDMISVTKKRPTGLVEIIFDLI